MIEILLIAVSLALDAFAVSVSSGISVPGFGRRQAVRMGAYFGLFQFAMPLAGWVLGSSVSSCIEAVDHWIAFGLLAFIGGRMVWGARGEEGEGTRGPEEAVPAGVWWCWQWPPASMRWPWGYPWPL